MNSEAALDSLDLSLVSRNRLRIFSHGPRCSITVESLAHIEITEHDTSTTLFSIKARICPKPPTPGLYLRIQDITFVKQGKGDLFAPVDKPLQIFKICPYINHSKILKLVRPIVTAYTTNKPVLPLRSNYDKCKTDFELAIQEHRDNVTLVITRWINLGPGLTPDDLR